MDLFPFLYANTYENPDFESDNKTAFKGFYTLRIPYHISKINADKINANIEYNNKNDIITFGSVVKSYRNSSDSHQIELSVKTLDDENFKTFINQLNTDDLLVILKRKKIFEYELIGIKFNDELYNEIIKYESNLYILFENPVKTKTPIDITLFNDNQNTVIEHTPKQKIYYGVPGSGKSFHIDCDLEQLNIIKKDENGEIVVNNKTMQTKRVVFHPEYTNSDFIGQILPKIKKIPKDGSEKQYEEIISYDFTPGPFTEILIKAYLDQNNSYALIIEEINRGSAAAIFGEIFQLLDRFSDGESECCNDYNYGKGWSSYTISNDLITNELIKAYETPLKKNPYINKELFDKYGLNIGIRLPPNLSVFATMNTSDQNVFKLDNAFKRRWELQLIENEFDDSESSKLQANSEVEGFGFTWGAFKEAVNDFITSPDHNDDLSSFSDKQLGCWFVKNENGFIKFNTFTNKVLEYLWDDVFTDDYTIFNTEKYHTFSELLRGAKSQDNKDIFIEGFVTRDIENAQDELDQKFTNVETEIQIQKAEINDTRLLYFEDIVKKNINGQLEIHAVNSGYFGFKLNGKGYNFATFSIRKKFILAEFYISDLPEIRTILETNFGKDMVTHKIDKYHCNREMFTVKITDSLDILKNKETDLIKVFTAAYDYR